MERNPVDSYVIMIGDNQGNFFTTQGDQDLLLTAGIEDSVEDFINTKIDEIRKQPYVTSVKIFQKVYEASDLEDKAMKQLENIVSNFAEENKKDE